MQIESVECPWVGIWSIAEGRCSSSQQDVPQGANPYESCKPVSARVKIGSKEKAEEKCFQLLDEAKFGTGGHGCIKSLGREDVQF